MISDIRVHIYFDIKNGPWGGGNQFLRSLRKELIRRDAYSDSIEEANIVLFNSHHIFKNFNLLEWFKLFRLLKGKAILHRIDGPIFSIRDRDYILDRFIFLFNRFFSTGTIFQSAWSREKCFSLGMKEPSDHTTLINATDDGIFNQSNRSRTKGKVKLIASSWSSNMNKGFTFYKYLDEKLDFDKFQMGFAGNSPCSFNNIEMLGALDSGELAEELHSCDIYITASKNDPCSNALIEALSAGLPSICLNSGGHPEIVRSGGELFQTKEELIEKIELVSSNLTSYQKKIPVYTLKKTTDQYLSFAKSLNNIKNRDGWFFKVLTLGLIWFTYKLKDRIKSFK